MMRSRRCAPAWASLVVLLLVGAVSAGEGAEDVPLYTNEDLERMFGEPDPSGGVEAQEDWGFVLDFLDHQYARIDADRAYELEWGRIEQEPLVVAPRFRAYRYRPSWGVFPRARHGRGRRAPAVLPHGNGLGVHGPGHGPYTRLLGQDAVPGPPPLRRANGTEAGPKLGPSRKGPSPGRGKKARR